jgi:hypothetical protein
VTTTTQQAATYAQIAQAAYATELVPNSNNTALFRNGAGMSQSQAELFDANWNVLSQSAPSLDGFSAVLLQNTVTGEKVLAIAGTDPLSRAHLLTDIAASREAFACAA